MNKSFFLKVLINLDIYFYKIITKHLKVFDIAHYRPIFRFVLDSKYSPHGQKTSILHRLDLCPPKLIQFYPNPRLKTVHNF